MGKPYEHSHLVTAAQTGAGRRAVESRLPKVIEPPKAMLLLKGHASSAVCNALLDELYVLKKPLCRKLQRKNDVLPFEPGGEAHLENLARLNDCALFALVNSTKKRPHNLVLGRTFQHRILDMFEFAVVDLRPAAAFPSVKSTVGSKPLVLFNGDDYDASETTRNMRSLLLDVFRGPDDVQALSLSGVDRVIVLTLCGDNCVKFRHYAVELRRAQGSALPKPVLKDAGPQFDLVLRRTQQAGDSLRKEAMKKPKHPSVVRKTKNVSRDQMGDKKGQIHVGRQDLSGLALARMKGLNKKRGMVQEEGGEVSKVEESGSTENATGKRQKVEAS